VNELFAEVKRDDSDVEDFGRAIDELVVAANVVLKQEWRRVRSGE